MYNPNQTDLSNLQYYSFSPSIGPECAEFPFGSHIVRLEPEVTPLANTSGPVRDSQSRLAASKRFSAELKIYKKIKSQQSLSKR